VAVSPGTVPARIVTPGEPTFDIRAACASGMPTWVPRTPISVFSSEPRISRSSGATSSTAATDWNSFSLTSRAAVVMAGPAVAITRLANVPTP
jgi:hypothetical protein